MRPRHAVLLAPSKSSRPIQLNYCQYVVRVSSLAATLTALPASVANKELTVGLSPLDATLMKNIGGRVMVKQRRSGFSDSTFKRPNVPTFQLTVHSLLSLFEQRVFKNPFEIRSFRTLSRNCRVYTYNSQLGTHPREYRCPPGSFFSCIYELQISYLLCFDFDPCNGGYAPPSFLPLSTLDCQLSSVPSVCTRLQEC
jgi:hypothetical protein